MQDLTKEAMAQGETEFLCTCCEKELNPKTLVWLEKNSSTATYHKVGTVPEADSQGCFTFGRACARNAKS